MITVKTEVDAPVDRVWECWTLPEHIIHWNHASEEWHTIRAENDLQPGGKFLFRMEAKDGSTGFDFTGTYTEIHEPDSIEYELEDGRKVRIVFDSVENLVTLTERFEPETSHPAELQKQGWQAILDNFKKYIES